MEKGLTTIDKPWTPEQLQNQVNEIQRAMAQVMKEGTHFGVIPGCEKPSLYKPGAEKLCLMFRLIPHFEYKQIDLENGHREFVFNCSLKSAAGETMGQGVGSASTMESKYRWRKAERVCPTCGKATIIKVQEKYGGGWLCWTKKGGCGAKFQAGDKAIEEQITGRVENPDVADHYNTVLKMAKKRAHVDATITTTAASDIFTQDVEDLPEFEAKATVVEQPAKPESKPAPKPVNAARDATKLAMEQGSSYHYDFEALKDIVTDPAAQEEVKALIRAAGGVIEGKILHCAKPIPTLAAYLSLDPHSQAVDEALGDDAPDWDTKPPEVVSQETARAKVAAMKKSKVLKPAEA